uniref:C2H2-type domain-containing protein n=1 Tax=Photinus pyralis TaxID=7054 RepID=A0A1Y1MYT8_PHOPY
MTTRAALKNKTKKPLETTLGKASTSSHEEIDLSHVGKTIHTSLFGLRQVLALFETATEEVQAYITYECDIMYECRICRTIFRSLANFILHKRKYCQDSYKKTKRFDFREQFSEADLLIINEKSEESKTINQEDKSPSCIQKPDSILKGVQSKKTLSNILPRLINKQENTLITEECLAEDNPQESKRLDEENKRNIALESANKSGVFQTMYDSKDDKLDFMKTEVMEIHDILENNEAIIGSNGKIVVPQGEKSDVLKNNFMCVICNQKFSTKKTLTYHINYKHNDTRKVYQCTECTDTFANTWGVFRHLYKTHRKTPAQVKKLRNQIHSNRIRNDEQTITKNSDAKSEVIVSDTTSTTLGSEDQQWIDDLECDNDLQRCGGCGRKFERKAALHSHSQFCTKRIAVCNSIKENNHKKAQEDKQEKKIAEPVAIALSDGSRKRKPLVAYKILRFDYMKDTPSSPGTNDKAVHSTRELVQSEEPDNKESDTKGEEIAALNTIISDLVHEIVNSKSSSTSLDEKSIPTNNPDECLQMDVENNNSQCESEKQSIKKKCLRALEKKCTDYINKERKLCLPCDKAFKTYKCLMRHMAVHFNWHRFQCAACQYTAYHRSKCEHHLEKKHSIVNQEAYSDYIKRIPFEKTLDLATDFINYAKKCKAEVQAKELIETAEVASNGNESEEQEIQVKESVEPTSNFKQLKPAKAPEEVQAEVSVESTVVANNDNWIKIENAPDEFLAKESIETMEVANNDGQIKIESEEIQGETTVAASNDGTSTEKSNLEGNSTIPQDISDPQDPALRDMIMTVIFGNNATVSSANSNPHVENNGTTEVEIIKERDLELCKNSKPNRNVETNIPAETKVTNHNHVVTSTGAREELDVQSKSARCRPIRARTATVRKDFLYDMTQILKLKPKKDLIVQKPLRVYTRKNKVVPPKTNNNSFNILQNVNINPIQVPDT